MSAETPPSTPVARETKSTAASAVTSEEVRLSQPETAAQVTKPQGRAKRQLTLAASSAAAARAPKAKTSGRIPAEPLEAELRQLGAEAAFIQADVRRDDEVNNLVDKTVARFGRLDVAVNNAGTEGQVGPITGQTAESYAATFDTNVLGVILSMKHEVRVMQGQGSGSIINISSTYGHEGAAGASVYVGSKHAVEGITKSVALETVKSGIRVNSVAPGPIDTGMLTRFTRTPENKAALVTTVPMDRLGLSEEVANAIVFIASDEASLLHSSRAMSSMSMAASPTDPIRARRFAPRPVKGRSYRGTLLAAGSQYSTRSALSGTSRCSCPSKALHSQELKR